ncbi:hypothetical protein IFM89_036285 [Coptis chinensis]|uniref:KIB1-4 beta-propeller domain-containing protein n=1 Tax=Coptis chinensis TaxID=261450 RepID=A0A835M871_9MAGN|nr:hypothetical protein IFM89_036285 [Coptis chinensis]
MLHLIDPLSNLVIEPIPRPFAERFNLLDHKICGVHKKYHLDAVTSMGRYYLRNITVFSSGTMNDMVIMGFYDMAELVCFRSCDRMWTKPGDISISIFHDLILYKGQFYTADSTGRTCIVDPHTLNVTVVVNPIVSRGHTNYLTESSGDLFRVCVYLKRVWKRIGSIRQRCRPIPVRCRVYRWDLKGKEWLEVIDLGDSMFSLSREHSYSVSSLDFPGCEGNCILLNDYRNMNNGEGIPVYNMEDGTFTELPVFQATYSYFGHPTPALN